MRVAIMQPYIFPYIGYFQLINAVDVFVFYDDVNFIKKGFIHRNHLLFDEKITRFTIPCKGISQNKRINKIKLDQESTAIQKLLNSIKQHYNRAPYFKDIMPLLDSFFNSIHPHQTISEFSIQSVQLVSNYLDLDTIFKISSIEHSESLHYGRADRLIAITKKEGGLEYINSIGGQNLYDKALFKKQGVDLCFLKSGQMTYKQFNNEFVPWLSIIDVLMFNSKNKVKDFLKHYKLV